MKPLLPLALAALSSLVVSQAAFAHASLETKTAPAGSHYKGVIKIGHGCDGAATQTLRVQLPLEVQHAKPMPKAGWQLELKREKLDVPYDYYGTQVSEDVRELVWTGGNLSDDHYDEFVFTARLAGEPGETLYLNTIQECTQGELRWTEIPADGQDPHDLPHPAPAITLTEAKHHH
ncbi:YcnI family protein [Oceanisphaera sediminis]|uniref:YcnI family protein n=1 Tax=Oceanisphaera sediminis TaxID=981381 RepID=A0ABP7E229_9GAMM